MSDRLSSSEPAEASVSVVIVNWRAPAETLGAVDGLRMQTISPRRIYVVDNGSGDDSMDQLHAALSSDPRVVLLANTQNLGFGGGCNRALTEAIDDGSDFVWLLNNDARPDPDCLAALLDRARADG